MPKAKMPKTRGEEELHKLPKNRIPGPDKDYNDITVTNHKEFHGRVRKDGLECQQPGCYRRGMANHLYPYWIRNPHNEGNEEATNALINDGYEARIQSGRRNTSSIISGEGEDNDDWGQTAAKKNRATAQPAHTVHPFRRTQATTRTKSTCPSTITKASRASIART
ncbi:hypothetical protein GGR56DRAFT_670077 [Xylariaceae sp. FL0804]|nr:hypothetical protein GGR56DRAFT_670077 [Xylariaceae sp. FL0804]